MSTKLKTFEICNMQWRNYWPPQTPLCGGSRLYSVLLLLLLLLLSLSLSSLLFDTVCLQADVQFDLLCSSTEHRGAAR